MEKHYEVDDEIEIDLKELFFELVNNWVMIAASTVLVALIVFCVSKFIMTPKYESTSELYVMSQGAIESLADIQIGSNLTNDYIVVVKDRPVLEQVINNLGLKENYAELLSKVSLNNPSNSRILQITVTDEDPYRAKAIADEIANVSAGFIADKMKQDRPSVISYGYADGDAVSPNVLMNTVLGAAIGAFLAMAIVIISYLLNDTIMTADDIERKLGLNVLGTLPLEEEEYDGRKSGTKKKTSEKSTVKTEVKTSSKSGGSSKSGSRPTGKTVKR